MISRTAACLAGVLGGVSWLARFVLDKVDPGLASGDWGVALHWAGGVWLALAAATGGARLVKAGTVWLRLVAAVGAVCLAAIAWSLADQVFDDLLAEAAIGVLVAAVSGLLYFRPDSRARRRASAGAAG
ncbi:MAG: hypothetical protein U0R80_02630 [Nocardioidaceae bacterium]